MKQAHHKIEIRNLRHKYWIMFILFFTVLGCWYLKSHEIIISPLSDNPVFAVEPTPIQQTWQNVVKLIVDEFSSEGPQVVYQAISIAKSEGGWRPNAYNYNTNHTADNCPFQINDVHIKKFGTKYQHDIKECIRVAHVIYKEQGWTPWVAAKKLGYAN